MTSIHANPPTTHIRGADRDQLPQLYECKARFLRRRPDVKQLGPSEGDRPRQGVRFVVLIPTTLQDGHATPAELAQRILAAFPNDAQRAIQQVDLVVGVNTMLTVTRPAAESLAPLATAVEGDFAIRTRVVTFGWAPEWCEASTHKPVHRGVVQQYVAHVASLREMYAEMERHAFGQTPIGELRNVLAMEAKDLQSSGGTERVWVVISDADTHFEPGFFDAIADTSDAVKVLSGGYAFSDQQDTFTQKQNDLDMRIRKQVCPLVPYYPEPSLAIDTSALKRPLFFGKGRLESRRLLAHVANSAREHLQLTPQSMLFSDDPRLRVRTDGTRFVTQTTAPQTFNGFITKLRQQPQSHADRFRWGHQLMAVSGVASSKLATLARLYDVPLLMTGGLLLPADVRTHLQRVDAWLLNRSQPKAPRDGAYDDLDAVFGVATLQVDPALARYIGRQMSSWAESTLQFIEDDVLGDHRPLTAAARRDYQQRLAQAERQPSVNVPRLVSEASTGFGATSLSHEDGLNNPAIDPPLLTHFLDELQRADALRLQRSASPPPAVVPTLDKSDVPALAEPSLVVTHASPPLTPRLFDAWSPGAVPWETGPSGHFRQGRSSLLRELSDLSDMEFSAGERESRKRDAKKAEIQSAIATIKKKRLSR